ncbi:MAG: hypothetical protein ACP5NY_04105 [Thermocladium sp.]
MVVYPQCRGASGEGKVICLINAVLDDYYSGRISSSLARRRLNYLIALNESNGWTRSGVVRALVREAMQEIEGPRRARAAAMYSVIY